MIWLNGDIVSAEAAISANDRGLLLGESVFETLLVKTKCRSFGRRIWRGLPLLAPHWG